VPASTSSAITVRVAPSDTLWTIASQHRLPGLSTAQMVRVIRDANPQSGTLTAGAVLQIPAEAMDGTAYAQVSGVGTAR
jgi:Tfp pilus assembly protein FimV